MMFAEASEFFSNPFVWGLALGLPFFALSAFAHLKTKFSLNRYKKLLSDKLEIEAEATLNARKERDALKVENENLRTRVTQLSEKTDGKIQRELEHLTKVNVAWQFVCAEETSVKSAEEHKEVKKIVYPKKFKIL